jgi:RNA polymerase sigma-70 factor, ECF subfamily
MLTRSPPESEPRESFQRSGSVGREVHPPDRSAEAVVPHVDGESSAWLARLGSAGRERDAAIGELHALLVRAARFEVNRRRAMFPQLRGNDQEDLAQQSADDALMAILTKLDDFRGVSRFTTWAYKFALYEAAAKVRKRAWQGREIPLEAEAWPLIADRSSGPDRDAETSELLGALHDAIGSDLTPHQREIFVALALNEVPLDVLAERLNTTRGALYKALHDARQKLRASLAARDMSIDVIHEEKTT